MISRDLLIVSASALIGASASAVAFHFFSLRRRSSSPCTEPSVNGVGDLLSVSDPFDPSKRKGYLSWDDYFMAIAFLSAKRSKDPNRQVGACLVSQNGVILGIGYNGFPRGCSDDKLPWAKKSLTGNPLETKYPYVCHAEVNAVLNTNHASAAGQRLYVTMFPCNECAKIIIQIFIKCIAYMFCELKKLTLRVPGMIVMSGVAEVIYFIEKLSELDTAYIASRKLLSMAGIKVRKHQPQMPHILLQFEQS